jgi:hypothetical protein
MPSGKNNNNLSSHHHRDPVDSQTLEPAIHEAWASRVRTLLHPAIRQQIENPHVSVVVRNPKHNNRLELVPNFEPPLQAAQRRFAQRQALLAQEQREKILQQQQMQNRSPNNRRQNNKSSRSSVSTKNLIAGDDDGEDDALSPTSASTIRLGMNQNDDQEEEYDDSPSSFHRHHHQNQVSRNHHLEILQKQQKLSLIGAWNSDATKKQNQQIQSFSSSPVPRMTTATMTPEKKSKYPSANVVAVPAVSPRPMQHPLATASTKNQQQQNVGEISPLTEDGNFVSTSPPSKNNSNKKTTAAPTTEITATSSSSKNIKNKNQNNNSSDFSAADIARLGRQVHQHIKEIIETQGPNPSPRRTNIALDQISTLLELVANGGQSLSRPSDDETSPPMPNETPERIAATSLRRTGRGQEQQQQNQQQNQKEFHLLTERAKNQNDLVAVITTKTTKKVTTKNVPISEDGDDAENRNQDRSGKKNNASERKIVKKEKPEWVSVSSPKYGKNNRLQQEAEEENKKIELKSSKPVAKKSRTPSENSRLPRVDASIEKDRTVRTSSNPKSTSSSSNLLQQLANDSNNNNNNENEENEQEQEQKNQEAPISIQQQQQHFVRPYTQEEIDWLRRYAADYPVEYSAWYYQTFGVPATYQSQNQNKDQNKNNNNNNNNNNISPSLIYTPLHVAGSGMKIRVNNNSNSNQTSNSVSRSSSIHKINQQQPKRRISEATTNSDANSMIHNENATMKMMMGEEDHHFEQNRNNHNYQPFDFDRYDQEEDDVFNLRQVERRVQEIQQQQQEHRESTTTSSKNRSSSASRRKAEQNNNNNNKLKPELPNAARGTILKAGTRAHQFSNSSSSYAKLHNSANQQQQSSRRTSRSNSNTADVVPVKEKTNIYKTNEENSASSLKQGLQHVHDNLAAKYGNQQQERKNPPSTTISANISSFSSNYPSLPVSRDYPQRYNFTISGNRTHSGKENVLVDNKNQNQTQSQQQQQHAHRRSASEIALDILRQEEKFRHDVVNEQLRSVSSSSNNHKSNKRSKSSSYRTDF